MISRTHDEFLSTLPARGATVFDETYTPDIPISIHAPREGSDRSPKVFGSGGLCNFYPRSPRGERPVCRCCLEHVPEISIHAPREGSDLFW